MEQLMPKERHNYAHLSVPNNEIIANAYNRKQISHSLAPCRYYRCLNCFGRDTDLESGGSASTIAGFLYSIGLDAFVPADAAVAALFLTAALESSFTCVWGDCSNSLPFVYALSHKGVQRGLSSTVGMALERKSC